MTLPNCYPHLTHTLLYWHLGLYIHLYKVYLELKHKCSDQWTTSYSDRVQCRSKPRLLSQFLVLEAYLKYNCIIILANNQILFKFAAHSRGYCNPSPERWQSGRMHWS